MDLQNIISKMNLALPLESCHLDSQSSSIKQLELQLYESLKSRVLNIPAPPKSLHVNEPKLAILFSGGLDCTVLARMAHALLPANDQIDLLNVAFENPRVVQAAKSKANRNQPAEVTCMESAYESCPDRITGRKALRELRKICPGRTWRFVEVRYS
jgi:asparagine synthetase B (glutamine-hydrolysing)